MSRWQPEPGSRTARWLSREVAELFADAARCGERPGATAPAFDVLIVGSGYGGAVAAAELAGATTREGLPARVAVLERGREYLPGAFPSRLSELPTHLRGSFAGRSRGGEGLFDLRADGDVSVVLANGLGGGSLINAGVMEIPRPTVFDARWPTVLRGGAALAEAYDDALRMVGGIVDGHANRIGRHAAHVRALPAKTEVLRSLAPERFREATLTVAMSDRPSAGGVQLQACRRCGDCATGCNHGAKESLDTNLLVRAAQAGAEIYCGATVLRICRPPDRRDGWSVQLTHSDGRLRAREGRAFWIGARRVVLAAGALGSTEILLRSRDADRGLRLSDRLGERFSTNGDMIAFGYDYGERGRANAVADEDQAPSERRVGPTIAGVVDVREPTSAAGPGWSGVIEEMAVPGALRRAAEESITTTHTLHRLATRDATAHADGHPADDPHAVHRERIRDMSVFAAMGDDRSGGCLRLRDDDGDSDGQVDIVWPQASRLPLFDAQVATIERLARAAGHRGWTFANPVWRFLPPDMAAMLGTGHGPPVTVHPLGGCAMADSIDDGVVDDRGRVFAAGAADSGTHFHEGLFVLDGAAIPGALSTNPALTIAAVALRAVRLLRRDWGWARSEPAAPALLVRPWLRDVERETREAATRPAEGTVVGVTERLAGVAVLRDRAGLKQRCRVELTLSYEPLRLQNLFTPDAQGRLSGARLRVRTGRSAATHLRVFLHDEWLRLQQLGVADAERERLEAQAARSFDVSGSLTILQRAPSGAFGRALRAGWAWWRNRGARDIWQHWRGGSGSGRSSAGWWRRLRDLWRLASHAGEIRRFVYALRIGGEQPAARALDPSPALFDPPAGFVGGTAAGGKRITYARPSNPWRQLQELTLTELGGALAEPALLALDPEYFAERSHPLLRIESQRDHVEALADLASLAAYVLRMQLSIHIWNARKPDAPRVRAVERLPGAVPGLPPPQVHTLEVDAHGDRPVRIRLARYRRDDAPPPTAARPPVLLIHGYSASGTTFAHPALKPGLAPYLAQRGREVWVVDLRSSAGLETAAQPWTFEQVGLNDIPAAIDFIWQRSGGLRIDVVAHCMGAVMLSMAVLSSRKTPDELAELLRPRGADPATAVDDRYFAERRALPRRIRRVVLSQNGPVMVMSQQNVFRAYVMSYLATLFGSRPYHFRIEPEQDLAAGLFDRLLGSLPYPDDELERENSWKVWRDTRYVGTRHRMDALYGRTFSLRNLDDDVLDAIDDLFGPLNLDTVAQVIHFSLLQTITSRAGRNRFVSREALRDCWTFPTLAVHGAENGLADIATPYRLRAVMRAAGRDVEIVRLEGQGHQDSLIGIRSAETFAHIERFLARNGDDAALRAADERCVVVAPGLGPLLSVDAAGDVWVGLGTPPRLLQADMLCVLPVEPGSDGWSYARLLAALKLDLKQTLQPVDGTGDWIVQRLPAWTCTGAVAVDHVLLLLVDVPSGRDVEDAALALALADALARLDADPAADERLGLLDLSWRRRSGVDALTLALGSCLYPPGIFNHVPAEAAWRRLNAQLDRGDGPQLLVLTGDQIYVDATAGLFDPAQVQDRYARPHETWLRAPPVRDALRRVPVVTMLDDHEIDDNWQPVAGAPGDAAFDANERLRREGVAHFLRYQRPAGGTPDALSFAFERSGVHGFVLDTRTQRTHRASTHLDAAMFAQWPELETWLLDPVRRDRPKLIVSPAAILPRHRRAAPARHAFGAADAGPHAALRSDGWDGYPQSFCRLLALIADERIRHVVFLSGDEHLGLLVQARLRSPRMAPHERGVRLLSIHTPGLNTPYRFANAQPSDFLLDERFRFSDGGGRYGCAVRSQVFAGAGFTHVDVARGADGWTLRCEFDDGSESASRVRTFRL